MTKAITWTRVCNRIAATSVAVLLSVPCAAVAADGEHHHGDRGGHGLAMVADLVIARPLGLVCTVAGTAFFLLGLPFEAASGDIQTPAHYLIVEPARYTFRRPLGNIS
ncbi:MAG TPA: hypothetical protein VGK20_18150 [Candidatus Binatia bacterium]|jgi:hypothetical protein